jgi:fibronectin type 3 domain-containing protein
VLVTLGQNVTAYNDTGLTASTTYYYRVRGTNGTVNSGYSNENFATTQAPPAVIPTAPTNLRVTGTTQTTIALAWSDNSNNETGFRIERSNNGTTGWTLITTVNSNVTTFTNTGLKKRQSYYYRVRANGTGGNSAWSNVATGRTLNGSTPSGTANGNSVFSNANQISASLNIADLDDVLV